MKRVALCLALALATGAASAASPSPANELAGLWEAKLRFGPDLRGPLTIIHSSDGKWRGELAGHTVTAKLDGERVTLDFGDGNSFAGSFTAKRKSISGFWAQSERVENGTRYASPVSLTAGGPDMWRGEVVPLDDALTLYLVLQPRSDGRMSAFVRNPERNLGRWLDVDRLERKGNALRLLAGTRQHNGLVGDGTFHDGDTLSFIIRGMSVDFHRVAENGMSDFHPRGRPSLPYAYEPPPARDDGWPTGTLEEVGLSRPAIERLVQMIIDTPMDSVHAPEIHALLIARHGKLVLEEYFHGEHRDKPHDTRSAAKSLTSTLVGAAIAAGLPVDVTLPVYRVMNGGAFADGLEPRKRALTVAHLLTMSSGLDCDDRDEHSPGNEDAMQEQRKELDWYKYTLDLKQLRAPGDKAVYCSVNPNLAGGVLARATGQPLTTLMRELIAAPLGITRYWMPLSPTGDAYMGGGVRFLPRDFMKLGQLMLDGGVWRGRRVVSAEWAKQATSPLYELQGLHYGYNWWVIEFPYRGQKLRAFFAGGNGGQLVMGIPALELLITFYAGNYADPVFYSFQQQYVPRYVLPAVDEKR